MMIPAQFTITHGKGEHAFDLECGPASIEVDCRGDAVVVRIVQDDGDLTGLVELAPDQAKLLAVLLLKAATDCEKGIAAVL
jgi:hypothetical protein